MAGERRVAAMQHRLPSQGSSNTASYTNFTPPETLPSPSGTMLDASQTTFDTDTQGSDVPLADSTGDEAWFTGMGHTWQDLGPAVNRCSASNAGPESIMETQNHWDVASFEHAHPPVPYPRYAYDNRGIAVEVRAHLIPENYRAGYNQGCYREQSQLMHQRIEAWEYAYQHIPQSEQGVQENLLSSHRPRYMPPIDDGVAVPWSPWIARQHTNSDPLVGEILYDPAAELAACEPLHSSLAFGANPAEGPSSDGPVKTDASSDGAMPEDNIDPPPRPDPVGPPTELCRYGHEDDEMCIGCTKKVKESLLGPCIRIRLPDLTKVFIPASLAEQGDPEKLCALAEKWVRRHLDNHMVVELTWGYFRPIKCHATEVEPLGPNLLLQNQFRLDLATNRYDAVTVPSPPLGMVMTPASEWRLEFNKYLEELLETRFGRFPEFCFRGDDCRVARDFLIPIFEYHKRATTKARELVHQSLKLVILTHIMTHQLTLVESTRDSVYEQLKNRPPEKYGPHTSPRWLSRQFKSLLSTLHLVIFNGVLGLVQDTLRRADRKAFWAALFASILVVAMTTETQEQTVRCKEQTDQGEGTIGLDDKRADEEISLMDEKFEFLKNLFHQGYRTLSPKGFNPLQSPASRDSLDQASQSFAVKAKAIVEQHCEAHSKVPAVS
ncbi:MAG: hypothetical protein Q9207_002395 [Kuettlingeria erythrocarpa]